MQDIIIQVSELIKQKDRQSLAKVSFQLRNEFHFLDGRERMNPRVYSVPTSSGNHGKSPKKFHAWKNHGNCKNLNNHGKLMDFFL